MTTTSTTSIAVDFMTKTITVSRAFLKASRKVGSPEFLILKQLTEEMPSFSISLRVKAVSRKSFQPSYAWMADYIQMHSDSQEAFNEFLEMRNELRNYHLVRYWFTHKYPNAGHPETFCENELMVA